MMAAALELFGAAILGLAVISGLAAAGPLGLAALGSVLGLGTTLVALVRQRRRAAGEARDHLETEIERWRTELDGAADRLLELEKSHPLYFTAEQRWTGESLELDRRCARLVNRTYQLYSSAHRQLQAAAEGLEAAVAEKPQSSKAYGRGWSLLHDQVVSLESEEAGGLEASALLTELDAAERQARVALAEVAELESAFREVAQRADAAAVRALGACTRRAELDLSTEHLTLHLEPALDEKERIERELATDPTRALAGFEAVLATLVETAERAERGNRLADRLRGQAPDRLDDLRERVERLRGDGWSLAEPGFDPDLRLDRGERQLSGIEERLEAGQEIEAEEEHAALLLGLDELEKMIETAVEARQRIVHEIARLEGEVVRLRERLPGARNTLRRLRREHATTAFEAADDNLDDLVPVLDEIDGWIQHIREDHSEQRYLSAVEDAETAGQLLGDGDALIDEIEGALRALEAQRESAGRELDRAEARAAELRGGPLRQPGVSARLRARLEAQIERVDELREASRAAKPDWREIAGAAVDAEGELEHLQEIVRLEGRAYGEAAEQEEALVALMKSLATSSETEKRDRLHVAEAVGGAQELLEAFQEALHSGDASGRQLLEQSQEVAGRLAWANGVWRSELDVIHQASTELRAAELKLQREDRRDCGYGVIVDCARGRSRLERARQLADSLEWERALTAAHDAAHAIDEDARRAAAAAD
ncbi:MAG: hypothetical protein AAF725_22245, partial [Acidobacteriota bacterium]